MFAFSTGQTNIWKRISISRSPKLAYSHLNVLFKYLTQYIPLPLQLMEVALLFLGEAFFSAGTGKLTQMGGAINMANAIK